jgi:hypothetical protein
MKNSRNIYIVAAAASASLQAWKHEGMLKGLAILGATSLKTTNIGVNDKHSTVRLGGTSK